MGIHEQNLDKAELITDIKNTKRILCQIEDYIESGFIYSTNNEASVNNIDPTNSIKNLASNLIFLDEKLQSNLHCYDVMSAHLKQCEEELAQIVPLHNEI